MTRESARYDNGNPALRRAREQRGWSQEEMASLLETSAFTIYRWESGRAKPGPYYRQKLMTLFQQSAEELGFLPEESPLHAEPLRLLAVPPVSSTQVIGRAEQIGQVQNYLHQPGRYALVGLPGVGKTTLAACIAHLPDIEATYSDGILWIGLGSSPPLTSLLGQLALRLGFPASEIARMSSSTALAQQIQSLLIGRHLLLIIDDVWRLEDTALLAFANDSISLLITTRFPAVAHAFALDNTIKLAELDEPQSLELLHLLAPSVVRQHAASMRDLAVTVGGLPLALTLIGHYLQVQYLTGHVRRLQNALKQVQESTFRLTVADVAPIPEQHRWQHAGGYWSLQASIKLSVSSLGQGEQTLLNALVVFPPKPNTFSEEAASAMSGMESHVYLATLDTLVDAGLIENYIAERYTIHQTIVDYMGKPTIAPLALQRLIAYYIAMAESTQDDYASFDAEMVNLLAILSAASPFPQIAGQLRLTQHMAMFLFLRGRHAEAEACLQQCRTAIHPGADAVEEVAIILLLSRAALNLGRLDEALARAEEGGKMAQHTVLVEMEIAAWQLQGEIQRRTGHTEAAEQAFQTGWHMIQSEAPHHPMNYALIASLLIGLGNIATMHGDLTQAEVWFRQGLDHAHHQHSSRRECSFLLNLGIIASERGDYATAYQLFLETSELAERIQYMEPLILAYADLTLAATDLGRLEIAQQWGEKAVRLARQVTNNERLCAALDNLSGAITELGKYEEAERYVREGLTLAEQMGNTFWQGALLMTLGRVFRLQGNTEAEGQLQRGKQMAQEGRITFLIADFDLELGEYYAAHHVWETALAHFSEAQSLAEQAEFQGRVGKALFGKARIFWMQGDFDEAIQTAKASLGILERTHSRYSQEIEVWLANHTRE